MRFLLLSLSLVWSTLGLAYPVDSALFTGIQRLDAYQLRLSQPVAKVKKPVPGARLKRDQIRLRLLDEGLRLESLPARDPQLEAQLRAVLGSDADRYSVALLDLTDLTSPVYAEHRAEQSFNPGSVGKLAVAVGFFQALANIYPKELKFRDSVLRDGRLSAEPFVRRATHSVPFWDAERQSMTFRKPRPGDTVNLWSWMDWTLSASSNVAASMVLREAMLMQHFGEAYPGTDQQRDAFFRDTPSTERSALLRKTLDSGLMQSSIDVEKFRQGGFFTSGARYLAAGGESYATTRELIKLLVAMEQGTLVDEYSSRELKRLLYMTQKRIRYASSPELNHAALFFKSGSLYRCFSSPCPKYQGDKENLLNSVVIVEDPAADEAGLHYMVVVSSNVLRENSALAHQRLAGRIHALLRERNARELDVGR